MILMLPSEVPPIIWRPFREKDLHIYRVYFLKKIAVGCQTVLVGFGVKYLKIHCLE